MVFVVLLLVTLLALAVTGFRRESILASFRDLQTFSFFGPLDAVAGYQAIIRCMGQAAIVFGLGLVLTIVAGKHHTLAGSIALILTTADLAAANSRFVLMVPQSVFEGKPEAVKVIEAAERADPSPGPFRVHRMMDWHPFSWPNTRSPDRVLEVARWMRDTLDPKHAIEYGLEYTYSIGVGELADYDKFFATFYLRVPDDRAASTLGVPVGEPVVYFPRRAYDLWNTRYFIVAFDAGGWREPSRSSAPLLFQTSQICPDPAAFAGPQGTEKARNWAKNRDFRVLRNLVEYPRAWIVHAARKTNPDTARFRGLRSKTLYEILYAPDLLWKEASQPVYEPRSLAWVNSDDLTAIRPYLSGQTTGASETVTVSYPAPEQAVLDVRLDSPGIVVLADVHYPGWELAIDGQRAPIYRVNGMMRGSAVSAGRHRLVYTYAPMSFKIGRLVSIGGIAALLLLGLACFRWPLAPVVGART